jgi:hypothetical protein
VLVNRRLSQATAPLNINWPSGVTVIFASRKSPLVSEQRR